MFISWAWPFSWSFSPSVPLRICRALSTLSVSLSLSLSVCWFFIVFYYWFLNLTLGGWLGYHLTWDPVFVFHILLRGCFFGGASSRLQERFAYWDYWICALCSCQLETKLVITICLYVSILFFNFYIYKVCFLVLEDLVKLSLGVRLDWWWSELTVIFGSNK